MFIYLFIYLFLAVLGLRFCARAFASCGEKGPLFIAVRGPLTIAASLVAEHRLQTRRLSNCGSRAQLLRGMWIFPDQGSNPCPLHWQADSQPLCHQGSPLPILFIQRIKRISFSPCHSSSDSLDTIPSLPQHMACDIVTYNKKHIFGLHPRSWHRAPQTLGIP